jgi:hypothetical protein
MPRRPRFEKGERVDRRETKRQAVDPAPLRGRASPRETIRFRPSTGSGGSRRLRERPRVEKF